MKLLRVRKGLVQIGNSKAIILPTDFLQSMKVNDNDLFYITLKNGRIIIEKVDLDFVKASNYSV